MPSLLIPSRLEQCLHISHYPAVPASISTDTDVQSSQSQKVPTPFPPHYSSNILDDLCAFLQTHLRPTLNWQPKIHHLVGTCSYRDSWHSLHVHAVPFTSAYEQGSLYMNVLESLNVFS